MADEPGENEVLLDRAVGGDEAALAAFWERHRKRLRLMVRLRLDRRLQGRVDPPTYFKRLTSTWRNGCPSSPADAPSRLISGCDW